MPSTPNINLDVRVGTSHSTDPNNPNYYYTDVQASNQQWYSYAYTGGDDGHGGLDQTVGNGRDTAPLQLVADQRYQINSCEFTDDVQNQLSWQGNGNRAGVITDQNSQVETAKYTIYVTDSGNGNCTVRCDPPVINR